MESDLPRMYIPYVDRIFFDFFACLELTQWVHSLTYVPSDNILDLILTTEVDRVGELRWGCVFP